VSSVSERPKGAAAWVIYVGTSLAFVVVLTVAVFEEDLRSPRLFFALAVAVAVMVGTVVMLVRSRH
jgi:hypothetical protein